MSHKIDLVIFDMDGVLARLDRGRWLAQLSKLTGKEAAFLKATIWDSDFEPSAEAGSYGTGDAYLAEVNRRVGCTLTRTQWSQARGDAMTAQPETLGIAEALRGQCEIAMLTNNGSLLFECLPEILPAAHRVFGAAAHASFQFNARKPETLVFERILRRYNASPECAIFIDDEKEYVEGARRVGMHAIHYTGPAALRQRLIDHGLTLPDIPDGNAQP
jgi:FMN phosphatase YigB (HAD superfamily)